MAASLALTFTLPDGTALPMTAPIADQDAARLAAWVLADTQSVPDEMDADGKPLPRTVPWALKRLTEAFLVETFSRMAMYEHTQALAAVAQPKPVTINLA